MESSQRGKGPTTRTPSYGLRAFVRFVRKRGWSQAAMLFVGVAAIFGALLAAVLGSRLGSLYVVIPLGLVGAILIILAFACFFIGPAEESPDAEPTKESPDAEDVAQVGLEVPPDTPVRIPKGVPRGTAVRISASEDLDENDEGAGQDEPPDQ